MHDLTSDLGLALKLARIGRRLKLRDVAERAGTTPGYLRHIEAGRWRPSADLFRRLIDAIGIDHESPGRPL